MFTTSMTYFKEIHQYLVPQLSKKPSKTTPDLDLTRPRAKSYLKWSRSQNEHHHWILWVK